MTEVKVQINGKKTRENPGRPVYYDGVNQRYKKVLTELDELVGLDQVKNKIKEICALIEIQYKRQEKGLVSEPQSLHMIFKGNPFFTVKLKNN
ncbi:hypothetical protein [Natranaerofaba carboxydovora]|uniref:hypothetical protein n=1 Tax=Natranaerofaba carboxydovora TaxID=2742683 RepID=UPI001F144B98|nr:hypothetical protein [Natranaerofaba carboxydovora]UMZ73532.1 Stage V sporulation protein K [Natranaerofaba carboxydovora]